MSQDLVIKETLFRYVNTPDGMRFFLKAGILTEMIKDLEVSRLDHRRGAGVLPKPVLWGVNEENIRFMFLADFSENEITNISCWIDDCKMSNKK